MRRVVVYSLLSADGVAESPDRYIETFDEVMDANLGRVIGTQDACPARRRTYDDWAGYWPTADQNPSPASSTAPGRRRDVDAAGHSLASSTVIEGPVEGFVRDLKQQDGADIGIHGSIELARSLYRDGLVDDLRLVIAPATAGRGRRLFDDDGEVRRLDLVAARPRPLAPSSSTTACGEGGESVWSGGWGRSGLVGELLHRGGVPGDDDRSPSSTTVSGRGVGEVLPGGV